LTAAAPSERYAHLDLLRGLALFGVLLVNALSGFSISIFEYMQHATNPFVAEFLEFRALSLFAFLFGLGTAILAERVLTVVLLRRFAALFLFGIAHIVFVWNGDILALYAVCGFLLLPFLRLGPKALALLGAVALQLPRWISVPTAGHAAERLHGIEATRVYSTGTWAEILRFRCDEALHWLLPLWLMTLPMTLGLMLLGMAAWKTGALRRPREHRRALLVVFVAGALGAAADYAFDLDMPYLLAAVYGAAVLLWLDAARLPWIAALGRMALTNYLLQSVAMTLIFYSYGFGLFGRLSPAGVAAIAIAMYTAQMWWSQWWLRSHSFGPFEKLWRSVTYPNDLHRVSRL
jgi:uncharacterized protein